MRGIPPQRDALSEQRRGALLGRGRMLEGATLAWNVLGVVVLAGAAVAAHSVALAGFGFDSVIEIGASAVVLAELSADASSADRAARQRRAMRLIAVAFGLLAGYLLAQTAVVLATGHRAGHSAAGIWWTALTAAVMAGLAAAKRRVGRELVNVVLITEARVTAVDALLAGAVLVGLVLNTAGWWLADPAGAAVLGCYAVLEARHSWSA